MEGVFDSLRREGTRDPPAVPSRSFGEARSAGAVYNDHDNVVFEKGNPIFSHFILSPKSFAVIGNLPFRTNFEDTRSEVIKKAGYPVQTKEGNADILNKAFLVDTYKLDDIIITFDYNAEKHTINFIQVRDNSLVEHLKL